MMATMVIEKQRRHYRYHLTEGYTLKVTASSTFILKNQMKLSILAIAVVLSPSINARRVQDTTTSTPDATDPPSCAELRLTTAYIRETDDFAAKCLKEYGSDAKVADWTYDLSSFSEDQIQSMTTELGIEESFNTMHYFVSNEGKKYHRI